MEKIEFCTTAAVKGKRLDAALAAIFPQWSRSRIQSWIEASRVHVDGESVANRHRLSASHKIELRPDFPEVIPDEAEEIDLNIVWEDEHLLVVDKPAGLVVHPGAGNRSGTLLNALLAYEPALARLPRAGLVHRLDKDTSGLMVVSKSVEANGALIEALSARRVKRVYQAVVYGHMVAGGTVEAPIGRHKQNRIKMAVVSDGKPAVSHYRVISRLEKFSHIEVRLETGRTHQIRVHMAHIGHPLVGDPVYGGRLRIPAGANDELKSCLTTTKRQSLHACALAFKHPMTAEPLSWQSELPSDLVQLLEILAAG